MKSKNELQEQLSAEIEADNAPSIDDFLKELEEKEKNLNISSEMVIEIDEAEIDEEDVPDFLQAEFSSGAARRGEQYAEVFAPGLESVDSGEAANLRRRVEELESSLKELNATLQKRQIDFENYRKRIERERSESFRGQIGNLATQLLPVLDNLNRALDAAESFSGDQANNFRHFFDGIVMVNQQLNDVLAEMGVEPISSVGELFDPHFHDAVAIETNVGFSPNTVTGELLRGYRIGDKVIRPAMVKVASTPNTRPPADSTKTE